jgi:hypothetical protein
MKSKRRFLARSEITPDIADLCEQVVRWRQTRQHRERMPEPLWTLAASLARQHTVARIARIARLDYYALKERLGGFVGSRANQEGRPSFVELPVSLCAPSAECIIEMEHPRGGRMRIQVKGGATPDLVALSHGFWSRES